jgi:hypothetical protein
VSRSEEDNQFNQVRLKACLEPKNLAQLLSAAGQFWILQPGDHRRRDLASWA